MKDIDNNMTTTSNKGEINTLYATLPRVQIKAPNKEVKNNEKLTRVVNTTSNSKKICHQT